MKSSKAPEAGNRFIILIIGKDNVGYNILRRVMDFAWVKKDPRVYYVYGNGSLGQGKNKVESLYKNNNFKISGNENLHTISKVIKNDIYCDSVNGWDEILPNTISAMNYLRNVVDFDFIIRTNQSTYWNLPKLEDLLETLPSSNLYAGQIMSSGEIRFVSGSGIILSSDLVDQMIEKHDEIDSDLIDDVSISRFMDYRKVEPVSIPRPSIFFHFKKFKFFCSIDNLGTRQELSFRQAVSTYSSIRCKDSEHFIFGMDFRRDFLIVLAVKYYILFTRFLHGTANVLSGKRKYY